MHSGVGSALAITNQDRGWVGMGGRWDDPVSRQRLRAGDGARFERLEAESEDGFVRTHRGPPAKTGTLHRMISVGKWAPHRERNLASLFGVILTALAMACNH